MVNILDLPMPLRFCFPFLPFCSGSGCFHIAAGQLLWREFFYTAGYGTPNFDRMIGNPVCKQMDWDENEEFYRAWEEGRTGGEFYGSALRVGTAFKGLLRCSSSATMLPMLSLHDLFPFTVARSLWHPSLSPLSTERLKACLPGHNCISLQWQLL